MTFDLGPYHQKSYWPCLTSSVTKVGLNPALHFCFSRSFGCDFVMKTAKILHILWCLLCNICSCRWILSIFGTNDHQHESTFHEQYLDLDLYLQSHMGMILPEKILKCCTSLLYPHLLFWMDSCHVWHKGSHAWKNVLHVMTFELVGVTFKT